MHPPQNNKLVNLVARRWLKKGKVQPDPHSLHLLTLARWGLENGAEGDWPDDLRDVVEMQLDDLAQWRSEHSRGPRLMVLSMMVWRGGRRGRITDTATQRAARVLSSRAGSGL